MSKSVRPTITRAVRTTHQKTPRVTIKPILPPAPTLEAGEIDPNENPDQDDLATMETTNPEERLTPSIIKREQLKKKEQDLIKEILQQQKVLENMDNVVSTVRAELRRLQFDLNEVILQIKS